MSTKQKHFETLAVHGGQEPDPSTLSRGLPISRTSSFVFKSVKHGADLFALRELGYIYSRLTNPTVDALEQRITLLEGGAASVATASGTSAIHYAITTLTQVGDEIVSGSNLYGGTYTMFDAIFPTLGLKTHFVDARDPKNFKKAITPKTKALYIETIGNPALDFTDVEAVAKIAHEAEIPLIVDGTFTTPWLLRTIDYGADIVINSLTKWIGGHGTAIGGVLTDSGKFKWKGNKKFPLLNEPDPNYHGLRWAHDLPDALAPVAYALRVRTVPLRNLGACLSPDNAWIFLQGCETLSLRMARHVENAAKVAEYLASHPKVAWVRFPGLKDDPTYPVASKYLKKGFGGMVVFGVKGGVESGAKFIEALKLFSHLANVGDAKSLALHPASTSHSQMSEEQQKEAGLPPELVRLSIGIEHIDDILADIEQALAKA
ncbi:MAG: O-acetylhomoserine aminocarboxypropyltransferase/cysteine synthase [Synergistaceae bacterium]|jgi:O-acetylhomoserine (thiol)-lyase|nr:O-acetylhomoserine aminocarboxypropyltransferase/cysteine synthase [Synergistaceae bacterium]